MRRPVAICVVGALTGVAVFVAGAAGSHQASSEREARAQSARAAAAVRRAAVSAEDVARRDNLTKVCPRGAEGLGNSARRAIKRKLFREDGRVDLDALREMSNIAVAAARYLERKRAAPALPQRMGRARAVAADGSVSWQPLPYPKIGCALVPRGSASP